MTWVSHIHLFIIAFWALVGFPAAAWAIWELYRCGRKLKELETLTGRRGKS